MCDSSKLMLFFSVLIFIFPSKSLSIDSSSSASCPVDLGYVETVPWNTSQCQNGDEKLCCQTLLSLFGIGLAQHLKDTLLFQLPDSVSSSACLADFQTRLAAMSIPRSLVPSCFKNSTQFVANKSSCAGIETTQDWVGRVGNGTLLESSCEGDLTGLTRCSSCLDAGLRVTSDLKSLDPNETKCFYYTVLYAAGIVNELGPKDPTTAACIFGLPLAAATSSGHNSGRKALVLKLIFGFVGVLIGILAAFTLLVSCKSWNKRRKQDSVHQEFVSSLRARVMPNSGGKWFKLNELERATNGFSAKNLIGHGTHGVVYKGMLADGTLIAVKQMLDLDSTCDQDFANEVEIISKIRHRNLLPLRGCCVTSDNLNGKRRFLIYDYMSRGSLSENLCSYTDGGRRLTWPQRKSIVLDVAKGLAYLHYGIKPAIFHRDIKATNVLLDSEMKAKVADFGLARQSTEGQTHLTTRVAGTHGYLAPEYALYGQLTEKSDVYSFGILILEIMSGKKVLDTSNESALLITDWVWKLVNSKRVHEALDECIREEGPEGVMERFVLVGVLCAHAMVAFRPTIADALKMLEGDIEIPEVPDRPPPLSHKSFQSS
uniref:non-specific serine/threonine protein kinase n=1 Tax=Kalanchoe fedtschenkoi TaxID=63787 RepID=A0A7N0TT14_KALFE